MGLVRCKPRRRLLPLASFVFVPFAITGLRTKNKVGTLQHAEIQFLERFDEPTESLELFVPVNELNLGVIGPHAHALLHAENEPLLLYAQPVLGVALISVESGDVVIGRHDNALRIWKPSEHLATRKKHGGQV